MADTTRIYPQRKPGETAIPPPAPAPAPAAAAEPAPVPAARTTGPGVLERSLAATPPPRREPGPGKQVLAPVTRRGQLVLAPAAEDLELETANGRFELLGPYGTEAYEGDEVEVTGLPDPTARHPHTLPAILVQQMRRL